MGNTQVFMVPVDRTVNVQHEKTVTEKKAPTDDSIRLYAEIKDKAYDEIIDTIIINNNIISFKAIVYRECCSFKQICKYKLVINGNVLSGNISLDREYNNSSESRLDVASSVVRKISEKIAIDIVTSISGEL